MKKFYIRSLSGFIYAILIVGSIVGGPLTFGILMSVVLFTGLYEYRQILLKHQLNPHPVFHYLFPSIVYFTGLAEVLFFKTGTLLILLVPIIFFAMIFEFMIKKDNKLGHLGAALLGIMYIPVPLIILNLLFFESAALDAPIGFLLFSMIVLIWVNDTFAYFVGSLVGKHKLSPKISPNKTWEGSMGGLLFSLIGSYILYLIFGSFELWIWICLAFLVVVFGTLGDLFESVLKRSAGIKESGTILPGHGGILDRFDSLLIAAPFVFCFLYYILNYYGV